MQVSKQCFTWLLYVLPYLAAAQSPYWQRTYNQPVNTYPNVAISVDGSGFMMTGYYFTTPNSRAIKSFCFKADRQGEPVWGHRDTIIYEHVVSTRDSGYLILGSVASSSYWHKTIHKLNKSGIEQWRKKYTNLSEYISSVVQTRDLGYMVYGSRADSFYLNKLDASGNSVWIKQWQPDVVTFTDHPNLLELPDGGFLLNNTNSTHHLDPVTLIRTDALGNRLWRKPLLDSLTQFVATGTVTVEANQITYVASGFQRTYIRQLDLQGNLLRTATLPITSSLLIQDYYLSKRRLGGYWLCYVAPDSLGVWQDHLWRLDGNGVAVSHKLMPYGRYNLSSMAELSDSTLFFSGMSSDRNAFMMVTDTNGRVYRNLIRGDLSSSCNTRFPNWVVSATRTDGIIFHARTDSSSRFEIESDAGVYTVQAHPPTNDWSSISTTLNQSNLNRIDTIPLIINCLTNCPNLNVDITTPILRRCFPNEQTIRYCNNGTATAVNAYVEVKLDSLLEYLSSSIPLASRIGQTLRFNLGTIGVNRCHDFTVTSRSRCGDSTQLGQSLCTNVHIYPDTICANLPNWTGANLNVSGTCERDSVRFTITNVGRGNSSQVRRAVMDNASIVSNTLINLSANTQKIIRFPANGHTWRVSVEQEPNHPYRNTPTAVVEGCRANANTPISTLFLNQLPLDTRNPVQKTVCTTLIGSYDPNDKTSLPVGYGVNRLIEANQDIEYMVRFQNTGTDTAFTVVVKDTLSNLLDALSIQPLASSHRYEWTVLKNNILQFTFPNLLLVDSFHNEPKSHGFIKFHIKQKPNVALGSTISNQAAIYFDFNAPVITNRTQLTVGKQFIISGVSDEASPLRMRLVTYPNPTIDHAVLEILDGNEDRSNRHFQLLDATGRVVREGNFNGNRYEFSREGLNAGFYIFRVAQHGQLLGAGRIVIQ